LERIKKSISIKTLFGVNIKKERIILKDYELEKYFRNNKFNTNVKVEIDGKLYDIEKIIWLGYENGNEHIIKIKS